MEAIQRSQLVEQIVEQLTNRILDGDLPPGTPLRQLELAAELGISRTPLRQALRELLAEGFVVRGSGNGTLAVISLTREQSRDVYEVRAVIDGLAARLASERATAVDLQRLDELAEAIAGACEPFQLRRFIDVHARFHVGLLHAARNSALLSMERVVQMSSRMLYPRLDSNRQRMMTSASEHRRIFDAVAKGTPDDAEQLARRHVENALTTWLREGSLPRGEVGNMQVDELHVRGPGT